MSGSACDSQPPLEERRAGLSDQTLGRACALTTLALFAWSPILVLTLLVHGFVYLVGGVFVVELVALAVGAIGRRRGLPVLLDTAVRRALWAIFVITLVLACGPAVQFWKTMGPAILVSLVLARCIRAPRFEWMPPALLAATLVVPFIVGTTALLGDDPRWEMRGKLLLALANGSLHVGVLWHRRQRAY